MSKTISTQELCKLSGIPRSTVEGMAERLGIRSVGTVASKKKTEMKLWPKGAAAVLKKAYPLVRRNRKAKTE